MQVPHVPYEKPVILFNNQLFLELRKDSPRNAAILVFWKMQDIFLPSTVRLAVSESHSFYFCMQSYLIIRDHLIMCIPLLLNSIVLVVLFSI